jgi:hypothetical protein
MSYKVKQVDKYIDGPDGKIHIVEEIDGKEFTLKEAIKRGFARVGKSKMQKLFSENELKEMGYDYTEEKNKSKE